MPESGHFGGDTGQKEQAPRGGVNLTQFAIDIYAPRHDRVLAPDGFLFVTR